MICPLVVDVWCRYYFHVPLISLYGGRGVLALTLDIARAEGGNDDQLPAGCNVVRLPCSPPVSVSFSFV